MAARLKIGDYIFDSRGTSSTGPIATGDDVRFELDVEEVLSPTLTIEEYRFPIFHLYCSSDTESELKDLVDSQIIALRNVSGKDVIYENTSGTSLFEMRAVDWAKATTEIEVDYHQKTADIAFQIIGSLPSFDKGSGTIVGAAEDIVWEYEMTSNQAALLVATGKFVPTLDGTVPSSALENAQAWVNAVRSGTRPSWVPSELEVVNQLYRPTQVINQIGQDGEFNPVEVMIALKEPPQDITFPAGVVDANYGTSIVENTLDTRSNGTPTQEILIAGTFTIVTEGNTTFDASLERVSTADIFSTADAMIEQIRDHFTSAYQLSAATAFIMEEPIVEIDLTTGLVTFRILYVVNNITVWNERTTIRREEPTKFSRASDGTDWVYEPAGGPVITVEHMLEIESIGSPINYRSPAGLTPDWYRITSEQDHVYGARRVGGELRFTSRGSGVWKYINKTPRGPSSKETFQDTPFDQDIFPTR